MVARVTKLTKGGVGTMGRWLMRDGPKYEPFEQAVRDPEPTPIIVEDWGASLDRPSIPMEWTGSGSAMLGLSGDADIKAIARALQHGVGPHGEVLRTGGDDAEDDQKRVCAYAVVWSAPKSWSLLLASENETVRDAVIEAARVAEAAYISTLEQDLTVRRGKAGKRSEAIRGLVAVRAFHRTSSAGDPHIHVHWMIAASAASAVDGEYRALDGRVLFQAQKCAEAAANVAAQRHLERTLGISDWHWKEAGSVPVPEISSLEPAVEALSSARKHMQSISQHLGVPYALRSRTMDADLWRRHRELKAQIAEKLEHEMDEALKQGGEAAAFIRSQWQQVITGSGVSLDTIARQAPRHPQPVMSDLALLVETVGFTSPDEIQKAKDCIARHPGGVAALEAARDSLTVPLHVRTLAALPGAGKAKMQVAEIERQRQRLEAEIVTLRQSLATLERSEHQQTVWETHNYANTLLQKLVQSVGVFTPHDVVARLIATQGLSIPEAQKSAAKLLRYWVKNGDLHLANGLDLDIACHLLENGGISENTQHNHILARTKSLLPDEYVKQEIKLSEKAKKLSLEKRSSFLIDIPKEFSTEQAKAATMLAQGRALSVTVGVAGAGKTYLARPIVDAAKNSGFFVRVVARNRNLAEELGKELGCISEVFATVDTAWGKDKKTLWIVDEAGLADRGDLNILLDAVEKNQNYQIWLIGDRAQAQPIDRLGSFAVVEQAVDGSSLSQLTTSYRCKNWAEEHDLLRNIKIDEDAKNYVDHITDGGNNRRLLAVENSQKSHEALYQKLAETGELYRCLGEDTLILTKDNMSAGAVSSYVQSMRGIEVDLHTALRHNEQHAGIGDLIRVRQNSKKFGVKNGQVFKVVEIENGALVVQSTGYVKRTYILPKSFTEESVELAYAATVDSAQGVTADRAIVAADGMGRSLLYSASTRGRREPVFVVSPTASTTSEQVLCNALMLDDTAKTMREIRAEHERIRLEDTRLALQHMTNLLRNWKDKPVEPSRMASVWRDAGFQQNLDGSWWHPYAEPLREELKSFGDAWQGYCNRYATYKKEKQLAPVKKALLDAIRKMGEMPASVDPMSLRALWEDAGWRKENGEWKHPVGDLLPIESSQFLTAWQALGQRYESEQQRQVIEQAVNTLEAISRDIRQTLGWQAERDGPRLYAAGFAVGNDRQLVVREPIAKHPQVQEAAKKMLDALGYAAHVLAQPQGPTLSRAATSVSPLDMRSLKTQIEQSPKAAPNGPTGPTGPTPNKRGPGF